MSESRFRSATQSLVAFAFTRLGSLSVAPITHEVPREVTHEVTQEVNFGRHSRRPSQRSLTFPNSRTRELPHCDCPPPLPPHPPTQFVFSEDEVGFVHAARFRPRVVGCAFFFSVLVSFRLVLVGWFLLLVCAFVFAVLVSSGFGWVVFYFLPLLLWCSCFGRVRVWKCVGLMVPSDEVTNYFRFETKP